MTVDDLPLCFFSLSSAALAMKSSSNLSLMRSAQNSPHKPAFRTPMPAGAGRIVFGRERANNHGAEHAHLVEKREGETFSKPFE